METANDKKLFISILSDYGFKVTFGNEADTTFLRKSLQALIDSPVAIKEVSFAKNEFSAITLDSRSGIYDLACVDENENHFIVEMQLSEYQEFVHRMKFYALHRFNTLVKKGEYRFENLPKIFCIGFLAKNIFPHIVDYHNIGVTRNRKNEIIDDQITFVTVELDKFEKQVNEVTTDLDKLIYTMKNVHTVTEATQFPAFWSEDWLKKAIEEVDTRNMSPEQKLAYEMTISANVLAVKNENKKIDEAKRNKDEAFVINLLQQTDFTIDKIANLTGVSFDFIAAIQQKLNI